MNLSKEQKKILENIGLSNSDFYSIFGGKEFIKNEKLVAWFKDDAPEGTVIKMHNNKQEPERIVIVYIFHKHRYSLFTDGFFLPSKLQNKGIRTRCFKNQIEIAKKLSIKFLTSKCSRSDDKVEFGYRVGPLLGYNGLHKSKKLQLLKSEYCKTHTISKKIIDNILSCKDVLDLCSFPEGLECWKAIGWTFNAKFDLKDNSKSMKTFNQHIKKYT